MLHKFADHPQERLEERTSLPPDFPARIRKILRKKRLPKGNVYAVMPDGSYAAFKDTHKGEKVLATFLSQNMTPRGENVTSEFADLKVAALSKLAGFANERLAQKAHRAVVKQYGLTEADGEKYWKLKSAIYQKMGGEFTHKTAAAQKAPEAYRPRVELFIHDGRGNFLANKSDKGWQFPGGGIEKGQTLAQAARREALEEAGFRVTKVKSLAEPSKVPWPEWYKEVARQKGRGHFEGQLTHPMLAEIGRKDQKLYGSEGDALTKLKFVPLKKLIRDGEKRISQDHNDIKTDKGEVIPGFGIFTKDTLLHLKRIDAKLNKGGSMNKTAESFVPPPAVASAAARGLEYRAKASPSNKGGLSVSEAHQQGIGSGVQRAVNLKNRDAVSMDTINRMVSFFARHAGNESVSPENKGTPWNDKGYVAYLLWGGGAGKAWANSIKNKMESKEKPREADKMAAAVGAMKSAGLVDMYGRSPWLTTALVGGAGGALVGAAPGGKGYEQQTGVLPRALAGGVAGAAGSSLLHGGFRAFVAKESPMYRRYAPYILGSSAGYGGLWGLAGGNLLEAAHRDRQAQSQENRALKTAAVTGAATLGAGVLAGNMVSKTSMLNFLLSPPEP